MFFYYALAGLQAEYMRRFTPLFGKAEAWAMFCTEAAQMVAGERHPGPAYRAIKRYSL